MSLAPSTPRRLARRRMRRNIAGAAQWAGIWLLLGLIGWTAASYIARGIEAGAAALIEEVRRAP